LTPPTSTTRGSRSSRRAVAARVALLFDQHASMVFGLCRLLLRDHHEAEDAAQQTFVSAYRSMLRGSEPRDASPWLAAIARNECRARLRKRMRAPVALDGEVATQLADPTDLTDIADRRTELAEITVAMADLPLRQREAVALRDFLGLSYEEVASTLSVSVPVVESLLFRARRRLRDTVRTVPRYAAGVVVVPLAMRASVAREIPDFDSVRIGAGLVAGAFVALGAGLAKVISLPFAGKAATAVAVVAAGTGVIPLLDQPATQAPNSVIAAPAPQAVSGGPAAPAEAAVLEAEEQAPEDTLPPAVTVAESEAAVAPESVAVESDPASTSPESEESEESEAGDEPVRIAAAATSATTVDGVPVPPPPPPDEAGTATASECLDETEDTGEALAEVPADDSGVIEECADPGVTEVADPLPSAPAESVIEDEPQGSEASDPPAEGDVGEEADESQDGSEPGEDAGQAVEGDAEDGNADEDNSGEAEAEEGVEAGESGGEETPAQP
jgi:RNA polymerase sigma factor (sigma-70 family)